MNRNTINRINKSPLMAFVTVTGGGTSFIGEYLDISGGSKTILGFYVPYNAALFDDFIGQKPTKYVSEEAARLLAQESFNRAQKINTAAIGIGVSCSLATDANERVGRKHFMYLAVHSKEGVSVVNLELDGTRAHEERIVREEILKALDIEAEKAALNSLLLGESKIFTKEDFELDKDIVIFPGSFNPLHEGHIQAYEIAEDVMRNPIVFELSVSNCDKPPLALPEIKKRTEALNPYGYVLTNAPRFIDKIKVFKEEFPTKKLTFVVGIDTWRRIFMEKYYSSAEELKGVVDYIITNDIGFIVFPRNEDRLESDYTLSRVVRHELIDSYNMNISSTEIRNKLK